MAVGDKIIDIAESADRLLLTATPRVLRLWDDLQHITATVAQLSDRRRTPVAVTLNFFGQNLGSEHMLRLVRTVLPWANRLCLGPAVLHGLLLQCNAIGDPGASHLAYLMTHLTEPLQELDLTQNRITEQGVANLLLPLGADLRYPVAGCDGGVRALWLQLAHNPVRASVVQALTDSLAQTCPTLVCPKFAAARGRMVLPQRCGCQAKVHVVGLLPPAPAEPDGAEEASDSEAGSGEEDAEEEIVYQPMGSW